MLPLSRRIAVSANVVFSLYPTRNKVYLILSYLILDAGPVRVPRDWPVVLQPSCGSDPLERTQIYCADENMQRYDP